MTNTQTNTVLHASTIDRSRSQGLYETYVATNDPSDQLLASRVYCLETAKHDALIANSPLTAGVFEGMIIDYMVRAGRLKQPCSARRAYEIVDCAIESGRLEYNYQEGELEAITRYRDAMFPGKDIHDVLVVMAQADSTPA